MRVIHKPANSSGGVAVCCLHCCLLQVLSSSAMTIVELMIAPQQNTALTREPPQIPVQQSLQIVVDLHGIRQGSSSCCRGCSSCSQEYRLHMPQMQCTVPAMAQRQPPTAVLTAAPVRASAHVRLEGLLAIDQSMH